MCLSVCPTLRRGGVCQNFGVGGCPTAPPPPPPGRVGHCGGLWLSAKGAGQGILPVVRHFAYDRRVGGWVSNNPPPPPVRGGGTFVGLWVCQKSVVGGPLKSPPAPPPLVCPRKSSVDETNKPSENPLRCFRVCVLVHLSRRGSAAWVPPTAAGENYFDWVRVAQSSPCSQALLLPVGVPPTPAPACSVGGGGGAGGRDCGSTTRQMSMYAIRHSPRLLRPIPVPLPGVHPGSLPLLLYNSIPQWVVGWEPPRPQTHFQGLGGWGTGERGGVGEVRRAV